MGSSDFERKHPFATANGTDRSQFCIQNYGESTNAGDTTAVHAVVLISNSLFQRGVRANRHQIIFHSESKQIRVRHCTASKSFAGCSADRLEQAADAVRRWLRSPGYRMALAVSAEHRRVPQQDSAE